MGVLNSLLLGSTTAPLYKALIRSGLGHSTMGGGFSSSLKQATWSIGLKGVSKDDISKVQPLILETLRAVAKKGFSQEEIDAQMNSMDFGLREFSSASTNLGMSIFTGASGDWIYERDPIEGMMFAGPLKKFKEILAKDGQRYLEGLIEKHLLNNGARMSLEGVPDAKFVAREEAAEKKKLVDAKASMDKKRNSSSHERDCRTQGGAEVR